MKNSQKGFIVTLLIALIAMALGGGIFVYIKNKEVHKTSIVENVQNSNSVSVPQPTTGIVAQISENRSMETYKNISRIQN